MKISRFKTAAIGITLALISTVAVEVQAQGQMTGVRAMGMGEAFTAAATGSGALFHNPAGMSALMMYSVEASYVYDQQTGLSSLHASIVDGKSNGSLGGGVGYTFTVSSSDAAVPSFTGHDIVGALSMPVVPGWLIVGLALHYLNYSQLDEALADGVTLDAGLMVALGDYIAFGSAVRNILDVEHSGQNLQAGFGVNFHTRALQIGADAILSFDCEDDICTDYRGGLEYLVIERLPLRLGYHYDTDGSRQAVSAGAGWRHELFGLDILFRQDLDNGDDRMLGLAVDVYL